MKHRAEQFELPGVPTGRAETRVLECCCCELADRVHECERDGWHVHAIDVLPRRLGYRLSAQRICLESLKPEPKEPHGP